MSGIKQLKYYVWGVLNNRTNPMGRRIIRPIVLILATLNILSLMLYSYDPSLLIYKIVTEISYYSGVIFTIEYTLRLWVSNLDANKKEKRWNRVKYIFSFFGGVDFIAVLPLLIPLLLPEDHFAVEVINFTRIFLILKMIRYSKGFKLVKDVMQSVRKELTMVFSTALVVVTFASMLMYYIEKGHQPEVFSSIGQSFWWAVITFSTVGYGDIYPITPVGQLLGGVIAIISIGMVAMPTAIISSALTSRIQADKDKRVTKSEEKEVTKTENTDDKCPHCGEVISKK